MENGTVSKIGTNDVPKADSVSGLDLLYGVPLLWAAEFYIGMILLGYILLRSGGIEYKLEDHPVAILLTTFCSALITIVVTWVLVCRKYHKSFLDGFRITRVSRKTILTSLLMGAGYAVIGTLLCSRYSTGKGLFELMAQTPTGLACVLLLSIALPPVEEMYYHGFLFPALQKSWGNVAAVLAVTFWFGGMHGAQLIHDPIGIPIVVVAVAMWTVQRLVTKSLTAPLISHLTYNSCLVMITLVQLAFKK